MVTLKLINKIKSKVRKYSDVCVLQNRLPDFLLCLKTNVNEEDKELLLNDIDTILPYGITFSHSYEENHLEILFKVVE